MPLRAPISRVGHPSTTVCDQRGSVGRCPDRRTRELEGISVLQAQDRPEGLAYLGRDDLIAHLDSQRRSEIGSA